MPTILEKPHQDLTEDEPPIIYVEEEFIPIGARSKVHWSFVLTAGTTDDDIYKQGPGSLTNVVIQVEKILKVTIQDVVSPLAPWDAKRARDLLVQESEELKQEELVKNQRI